MVRRVVGLCALIVGVGSFAYASSSIPEAQLSSPAAYVAAGQTGSKTTTTHRKTTKRKKHHRKHAKKTAKKSSTAK
jgi:hypothetical protein